MNRHCLSQKSGCHPWHLSPPPVIHALFPFSFLRSLESIHFSVPPTAALIFHRDEESAAASLMAPPVVAAYSELCHITPPPLTLHCFRVIVSPFPWLNSPPPSAASSPRLSRPAPLAHALSLPVPPPTVNVPLCLFLGGCVLTVPLACTTSSLLPLPLTWSNSYLSFSSRLAHDFCAASSESFKCSVPPSPALFWQDGVPLFA